MTPELGPGPWRSCSDDDLQDPLNQKQRAFRVVVQKAVVANTPEPLR